MPDNTLCNEPSLTPKKTAHMHTHAQLSITIPPWHTLAPHTVDVTNVLQWILLSFIKRYSALHWICGGDVFNKVWAATSHSKSSMCEQLISKGHSPKGNLLSSATVGTMLPSVVTAPPDELQHQTSADAQSMFVNVSKLQPHLTYVAAHFNKGQVSQLQSHTVTDTPGVCQLPVKPS